MVGHVEPHGVVDEQGQVYLLGAQGLGLVHSQDVGLVADALAVNHWEMQTVQAKDLERTFGFVKSPQQRASRKLI